MRDLCGLIFVRRSSLFCHGAVSQLDPGQTYRCLLLKYILFAKQGGYTIILPVRIQYTVLCSLYIRCSYESLCTYKRHLINWHIVVATPMNEHTSESDCSVCWECLQSNKETEKILNRKYTIWCDLVFVYSIGRVIGQIVFGNNIIWKGSQMPYGSYSYFGPCKLAC